MGARGRPSFVGVGVALAASSQFRIDGQAPSEGGRLIVSSPMRGSASKPPPLLALALALALAAVLGALPGTAGAAGPLHRPVPKILSASWGTEEAVGCPSGAKELDNIPVTFNWFIRGLKLPSRDFQVIRSDGTVATPTCAIRFPPDERDEAQTVNLIGDFGNSAGPTPIAVRVVGKLEGKAPGAHRWRPIRHLAPVKVDPIAGGPYIVDAWTIMPSIYRRDKNRCEVGTTFVRVMWSERPHGLPDRRRSRRPRARFLSGALQAAERKNGRDRAARSRRSIRPRIVVQRRQHARPLPA